MSSQDIITCSGCSKEISTGNIISFENDFWHPECFKCMKCNKIIDISDQNILLCEDKPICSDCGYKCHVCGKAITGEAITADDMILHFSCFKCRCCGKYIDDLTYILVNNEIHCINCTYNNNIDEDIQSDFGISSPLKNDPYSLSPISNNVIISENDNNNNNNSHARISSGSMGEGEIGKKFTAKHCSMIPDKNAIQRISLMDNKMTELKSNYAPNLSSFQEENSIQDVQELDKNPNQNNYYTDGRKFTDEEYYILKVKNEQLISENDLLKEEQSNIVTKYEEKLEEEIKKNAAYEKTINNLLEEKRGLKDIISKNNEKLKKYEEDYKLDALKYENENNLFQIKYEDLKSIYEKEREERIIAESTIIRLQEEIHIRYLDELKYTYIYDIETKYQNEFEILENQKQCSLATFEYLNNEIKKMEKDVNSNKNDSDPNAVKTQSINDIQNKYNEITSKFKNELSNIQSQKKLVQNEVNLLKNLRKGLINDNLIYMERFRKLKAEESALQKKIQQLKKSSVYSSNYDLTQFNLKKDESYYDTLSINSTGTEMKPNESATNDITLKKMESSLNNSFAVYESINKMINDSFQPPKVEKSININKIVSEAAINPDLKDDSSPLSPSCNDDSRSVYVIPLNDTSSTSVPQSKSSTIKKLRKNKKNYASESVLFNDKKLIIKDENMAVSSDDLQKSAGSTSPLKPRIPETSHDFQYHKFLTPSKCEICNDIMWGREAKCKSCNMKCHIKCITEKMPECTKKPIDPEIAALYGFGTDLTKQASIESDYVPFIVKKCCEEVEKRGMDFEGIYRKSGRTLLMKNLISIFSRGEDPDLSEEGEFSEITIITSVLKQYFRELPEAVIPPEVYTKLTEILNRDKDKNEEQEVNIQDIKNCIDLLEITHYNTLRYIVKHLLKVSQYANINLMSIKNLAVVFGPTLIGSNEICPEVDFSSMGIKVKIINIILENADTIFPHINDN